MLIYTGGTIGMMQDVRSGQLRPFDFAHLYNQIPELKKLNIEISSTALEQPIDSSDMHPDIWIEIATIIEKYYNKYDGFVILHGSDTMAHTASALSFMLENISKPVILTGSQLPIGIIRTDGKENLITAIEIAGAMKGKRHLVPEVAVYFEFKLYRGNRIHKISAEQFQAFQSPNYPVLAEAGVHLKYNEPVILKSKSKRLKVYKKLNSNLGILKIFPGITPAFVSSVLNTPEIEAVILETFGSGNAPSDKWFLDLLKKAIDRGLIILNVTQCATGFVQQGKYQTSSGLKRIGIIGGEDITIEAAITKMMFLLGQRLSKNKIKKMLVQSLRGEITVK